MEYNDDQILSISEYEIMAKEYSNELKKRGFRLVQVDGNETRELIDNIFQDLFKIKSYLFMLGGFLNTGNFYSLNERQLKKLSIIFDWSGEVCQHRVVADKTKVFLAFLSTEAKLIKNLLSLAEKSNFETEIRKIIDARLNLISQILAV